MVQLDTLALKLRSQLHRIFQQAGDLVIEDGYAAGGDCADRELGLAWRAQLADDHHIEREVQRRGNFEGDWHSATRQAQYDRIVAIAVGG
jgi:hypothetical protein